MRILVADDELDALEILEDIIHRSVADAEVSVFSSSRQALECAAEQPFDVAFLDVEMPGMNGIRLAQHLKIYHPKINIVFVTAYREYSMEAFALYASDYILKPITADKIARAIEHLRYPVQRQRQGIYAVTFGEFELLSNGVPVPFGRSKSKEMLAILVDRRGAGVTKKELSFLLFGDSDYSRSRQDYINKIIRELERSLKEAGAEDIFVKRRSHYAVDPSKFGCDLYESELGSASALNSYSGSYMSQYPWSRFPFAR